MRITAFALLCFAVPAFAVDGVVLNGTTRRPQPGVEINLVQPSQDGMNQLGNATTDAEGKFRIDKVIPPGPGLLQATYGGVTYNQIITPGMPTTGVEVKVYESSKNSDIAKAAEHLILLEPSADQLRVSETFVFANDTTTTYDNPDRGSARFYLPKGAAEQSRVTITAPGGMPITRVAEKTSEPGIYKVTYPLKPGETRIDVAYATRAGDKFSGKIAASDASTHLVTPSTVTLTGDGIEPAGQEPQTQANVYNVTGLEYNVLITGTGALRSDAQATQSGEDDGSPKAVIAPARIYGRLYWILGLTFAILGLGGTMLYRRGTA